MRHFHARVNGKDCEIQQIGCYFPISDDEVEIRIVETAISGWSEGGPDGFGPIIESKGYIDSAFDMMVHDPHEKPYGKMERISLHADGKIRLAPLRITCERTSLGHYRIRGLRVNVKNAIVHVRVRES